jgi:uncharacterized repeat protein (TIGR02543 family)
MKNLFTYLKALWGAWGNLQSKDVRHDRRLTVGSPSGLDAKWKQNPFMRFAVVLTLIFTIGSGNVWGAESVVYTLITDTTGGSNCYATLSEDISITNHDKKIVWNAVGNTTLSPWRIGGKNITNTVRPIYSETAISDNVTKVVVTHGSYSLTAGATVILNVYSTAAAAAAGGTTNRISSVSGGTITANKVITFSRPTGHNWTGRFFRFEYTCSAGNSNKFLEFSQAEFYADVSSCEKIGAPTVTATPGDRQISLSWPNQSEASSYTVTCTGGTPGTVTGTTTKSCTITGLTNGTSYTWTVTPVGDGSTYCTDGNTAASASATPNVSRTITYYDKDGQHTTSLADGTNIATALTALYGGDDPVSCDATNYEYFVGWTNEEISGSSSSVTLLDDEVVNSTTAADTYYAVWSDIDPAAGASWTQVTSVSVGDVVVIAEIDHVTAGKTGKELAGWAGSTYGTGSDYTTTPAGTITWTVVTGYNSTGVAFKNSSNKYLYWTSGNTLDVNATLSANSSWSVSTESSRAKIQNNATTARVICWNEANPRFAAYESKSHGDATSSGASTKFYYPVFYKQTSAGTPEYITTCCTELGTINGSVSFSNVSPTSVTVGVPSDYVDKDNTNLEGYIFKRYTASTGGSAVETIETDDPSETTATFNTGLVANTAYYYTIIAKHSSSSCNSAETSPRKSYTITSYTVSYAAGTGGSGTNPGAHDPVLSGTSVTLKGNTFTAPAGKQFAGWNDGSNDYSVGDSYSVTGDKTMTAQWSCITPSISGHPSSASYTQGASPDNLSVTASGGTLSYQWKQCATIDGTYVNVASGGTSITYSPSTASVGTTYYKCVVTNTGSSCNTTATSNVATITISAASQCVAPTFSVAAGTYNSAQTVTISSTTPGSTIYYTTNGSTPTTSSSHGTEGEASASVTVSSSLTLKAIAYKGGMTTSDVSDAAYVICSTDPSFSTTSSSNISITGARVTCAGITKGTCDIDAYGIVYGTSANPTGNAQQKGTDASSNVSSYYVDLTGLTDATTYYARPYATVNGKTVYGTEISFTTLNTPVITVSETSRAFGTRKVDGSYEMTFTVSGSYLQANIGLAISGTNAAMFSVDETSLTPSTGTVSTTTITVTYTPTAAGSHSASISLTSTYATTKTVTLSGTGRYEDIYLTAMHEGVTAWSDYASGVTKAGDGYTIPNPGDIAVGDREGTGCEGIHYHFAGWVTNANKEAGTISGNIIEASGTKDASNKTFWAVWEKEAVDGGPSAYSVGDEGDYVLAALNKNDSKWYAIPTSPTLEGNKITGVEITVTTTGGVKHVTPSNASGYEWTIAASGDYYTISDGTSYLYHSNGGASGTDLAYGASTDYPWSITSDANGLILAGVVASTETVGSRGILYQYNTSSNPQVLNKFGGYALGNKDNAAYSRVQLLPITTGISYEDPKVECICSATVDAGDAAVDGSGTFSTTRIDVKATDAGTGHADCSYTDYGFVWSSSVTTPTLVEGTGAASTNCTKVPVGNDGQVTSFTGSLEGSFSANNAIYFRSYAKNGKSDGTYQYSDVVTITPRSVTFNLNGHGSSAPAAQFVNNGSKATDPSYAESVTGYIFGGWYKEEGCSKAWNFASDVVSDESKTLYAKWTPISYSVRFNDNDENYLGDATGSMSNESFDYDEEKALTTNAFSLAGYDFAGWATTPTGDVAYTDGASASNLSSTNSAVVDLYAIWTAKKYNVTLAATNETSSVGSQTVQATYNAAMPLVTTADGTPAVAAPSRTGYTFTGWEYSSTTYYNYNAGTSTLSSAHVWDQPNSTTTLTPKWSINSYTLTWNLAGGTVATAGTGASAGATGTPSSSVEYNAAIAVPTVTKSGYDFAGWDDTPASKMPASDVTYTAIWTAKTLNSISLAEDAVTIYDQQYVLIDVIYDPADILTKGYTLVSLPTKVVTTGSTNAQLKLSATKAGVVISETVSETISIQAKADGTKTTSVTVTINPLPRVHFVDNIHNETFADVVATISENALVATKTTPTHADVANPSSASSCENTHLHLVGWIRGDWPAYVAYMNGTGDAPTVSELTSATGYWFLPGADINVLTNDGKTFYAVWAVEE